MSREFTEEELRALQAEMDRLTVDDVLLQTVVSLINLGARKGGLTEEGGAEPDLDQLRLAIEGARALIPLLEARHGEQLAPVKQALSQLQMAYVQASGGEQPEDPGQPPAEPPRQQPGGAGPAQQSGRLWVPGQ